MSGFSFGEFVSVLVWGGGVVGMLYFLIFGYEKVKRRAVPQVLKATILIPVGLSVALACAAIFPLPV